ncbi:hypothetical protein SHL15_9020 [Streptomyces hygroscopicus subsp. limoneus]|nr:hypothetical protein SHL15_9020 [Streptomyces hygroscopicus subsp. limoneus]
MLTLRVAGMSVLICDAAGDLFFTGQPERLHEHIADSTLLVFDDKLGANAHSHVGAQRLASAASPTGSTTPSAPPPEPAAESRRSVTR